MELVYLWVEDYKNIKKQGFNFSPKFHCAYDGETLTIDKNDDNIDGFFGDNINVTAIVGKNGSGKSSLLEVLLNLFFKSPKLNNELDNEIWMILYDSSSNTFEPISLYKAKMYKHLNLKDKLSGRKVDIKRDIGYLCYNVLYNPAMSTVSSTFLSRISNSMRKYEGSIYKIDTKPKDMFNIFAFPSKEYGRVDIKQNENMMLINMFRINKKTRESINKELKTYKLDFTPVKLSVSLDTNVLLSKMPNDPIRNAWKQNACTKINLYCLYKIVFMVMSSYIHIEIEGMFEQYFIRDELLDERMKNSLLGFFKEKDEKYIRDFIASVKGEISLVSILKESLENEDVRRVAKLIDKINELSLDEDVLCDTIKDENTIIALLEFFPDFFRVEVLDKNGTKFHDFSSGEKHLIGFLYSSLHYLDYFSSKGKKKRVNFFVDEVDISLHPSWQKK